MSSTCVAPRPGADRSRVACVSAGPRAGRGASSAACRCDLRAAKASTSLAVTSSSVPRRDLLDVDPELGGTLAGRSGDPPAACSDSARAAACSSDSKRSSASTRLEQVAERLVDLQLLALAAAGAGAPPSRGRRRRGSPCLSRSRRAARPRRPPLAILHVPTDHHADSLLTSVVGIVTAIIAAADRIAASISLLPHDHLDARARASWGSHPARSRRPRPAAQRAKQPLARRLRRSRCPRTIRRFPPRSSRGCRLRPPESRSARVRAAPADQQSAARRRSPPPAPAAPGRVAPARPDSRRPPRSPGIPRAGRSAPRSSARPSHAPEALDSGADQISWIDHVERVQQLVLDVDGGCVARQQAAQAPARDRAATRR